MPSYAPPASRRTACFLLWAACFYSVHMLTSPAAAQLLPGDPEAGHAMAREVCSFCHVVEVGQVDDPSLGAPDFDDVAQDPAATELALRVFFRTPHQRMPNFTFTTTEENDIISYILSLRDAPRGSL